MREARKRRGSPRKGEAWQPKGCEASGLSGPLGAVTIPGLRQSHVDSRVPPWGHQATGRVWTTAQCEEAGPAVWKKPWKQTECKQAASQEAKASPGPLSTPALAPLTPREPGLVSPVSLYRASCVHTLTEAFPDQLPNLPIYPGFLSGRIPTP